MTLAVLDLPPAAAFAVDVAPERPGDAVAVGALVAQAFGPGRFAKTAERVREAARLRPDLSFCAWIPHPSHPGRSAELAGAVRLWSVHVGGAPALFLGPIAVASHLRGHGVAARLVEAACEAAGAAGETAVVLVGDLERFDSMGFSPVPSGRITLPGPVDGRRVLWRGLAPGALDALQGLLA